MLKKQAYHTSRDVLFHHLMVSTNQTKCLQMVCRVIQLLTDPCIYVYYVLAALYISGYAVLSAPDGVSRKYHDAYWRQNGHARDGAFKHRSVQGALRVPKCCAYATLPVLKLFSGF